MSNVITTGGAPAPAQPAAEHFPNVPLSQPATIGLATTGLAAPDAPKAELQEKEPSIAELIRAQREDREARKRFETESKDLKSQLEAARKELEEARRAQAAFDDDPISYAKGRKWSREQQLFYGQTLLYDLAPDQAPPDFRQRMFEERMTRKEREEQARKEEEAARSQQEAQVRNVQAYFQQLDQTFQTVDEVSYPESTAWFSDPDSGTLDRNNYLESLMHTANNMAEAALQEGKMADLSPANVARVLEAEVARRMALRDRRAASRKPSAETPAAPGRSGVQPAESLSTRNMNGSGTPQPPAMSEEERVRRAAAVAFRTR
jgi:hypothetical protein